MQSTLSSGNDIADAVRPSRPMGLGPKLRIAHVITDLSTGGAETVLLRLLERLDPQQCESEVFSLKQTHPVGDKIAQLGVPVRELRLNRLPTPKAFLNLARWLKDGKFDLVQTWMTHADLVGGLAARIAGLPVVWSIHAGHLDRRTHGLGIVLTVRLNALLSRSVPARILSCSEVARAEHEKLGYPGSNLTVVPNGFDVERFGPNAQAKKEVRAELGLPEGTTIVGLVGRFHPQKDIRTFVEAAKLIHRLHPGVHYVLIGKGMDSKNSELVRWVEATGARDCFHLLGPSEDLPRLTASFDVACSSSCYGEAFPLVIGEAMASAVPCVVTDCGDAALMVGDTGRVVPIRNPPALAAGVGALVEMGPSGRAALGAAARARIEANFSIDKMVNEYVALYEAATGHRPRA